ncbi:MAG: TRAP transporter large permease subunit [Pseudomonadota bacterium]
MTSLLVIFVIIILALYGTPLFVVLGSIALFSFFREGYGADSGPLVIMPLYDIVSSQPVLLAIPLFTFAGYMMAESKTPQRLVELARAYIGWMPGGIALVTLFTCAIFTAFTGATGVTIIALGGLMYPVLLKDMYGEKFSLGLITGAGNIGLLFPPSLPIILYALVVPKDGDMMVSVDQLFAAGLLPGLLILMVIGIYVILYAKQKRLSTYKFTFTEALRATQNAIWEIPLPFIIIIGIYGGYFTATEAASFVAFYVFVIEVFIYKDISLKKDLPKVITESMMLTGGVLIVLGTAMGLANYMIDAQIPMKILSFMEQFITSKFVFLMTLNIFLLVVGFLLDIFSATLVVVPLIAPIASSFGINPVHLGIIFLTNLGIGYLTPPVGMNLFIASFRFNKPVLTLYRASLPFLFLLLISLIIITYVPFLSTYVVELLNIK